MNQLNALEKSGNSNDLNTMDPNSKKMLTSLVGMMGQFRSIG
jgi:hypothetical protein